MKKYLTPRRILNILLILLTGWMLAGYVAALVFTYPAQKAIEDIDSVGGFAVREVKIRSTDSLDLSAWLVPNDSSRAVVLLAGIRGNRTFNLSRAELYLKRGYTVLLPDLRGTGESEGELVTFGWQERHDLHACVDYLRKKGYKSIGVHGTSMGAATIAYSFIEKPSYSFVVMESCYDNIDNAFSNRVYGLLPRFALWPAYFFTEWRIKAEAKDLYPQECVKNCSCPVLYFAGDSEQQIRQEDTDRIFMNFTSSNKALHIFEGGKHEDFMKRYQGEYVNVWSKFMNSHEEAK
jgi:uncharacterized protein